jgi:DNA-binding SARP family transcriptional activator
MRYLQSLTAIIDDKLTQSITMYTSIQPRSVAHSVEFVMSASSGVLGLRLMGAFAAFGATARTNILISSRKTRALLAYLAMHADEAIDREQLADLLWEVREERDIRHNLRQSLLDLRRLMKPFPGLVVIERDAVTVNSAFCQTDAAQFARTVDAGEFDLAAALYTGEFLKNFNVRTETFGDWVRGERARLNGLAERVFELTALSALQAGEGQRALIAAEKLVALDPLREDWQRLLLQVYAKFRGRHRAIAHAREVVALLKRDLDVAPEPESGSAGADPTGRRDAAGLRH